jgi:Homeodomain-like domain
MKKYIVKLTEQEREELEQMISTGKHSARKLMHARILLKADESAEGPHWTDEQICEAIGASFSTIGRVRQQFVEKGVEAAISRRTGSGIRDLKIDGEREAHLVALTCSTPPEGQERWTLRMLADKMVELEYIESISYETVRRTLKKMN